MVHLIAFKGAKLFTVWQRVTFFVLILLGPHQSLFAENLDELAIYERLGIQSQSELNVPEIKVEPLGLLESHWDKKQSTSSTGKIRWQKQTHHYLQKKVEFRNALGFKVKGLLLTPWGPHMRGPLPTVIVHHSQGVYNKKLGVNELFAVDEMGETDAGQDWQWAQVLMNQGYIVLALDHYEYGETYREESIDYEKHWQLSLEQIQLLSDLQAFSYVRGMKQVGSIAILSHASSFKRTQALKTALFHQDIKTIEHTQSQWSYLDVYKTVKELNRVLGNFKTREVTNTSASHLLINDKGEEPSEPKLSKDFFWKMVKQNHEKRKSQASMDCQKSLSERVEATVPQQGELF